MFEQIAWIIIVNLALYIKTLRFKFVSDDFSCWKNPPVAKNAWHKLWLEITPMARWDWIRWIRGTKNTDTFKKHVRVALSKLKNGDRRPRQVLI